MARMIDDMARMLAGEIEQPAAARLVGMRLASYGDGEAVVAIDIDGRHANPMGTAQGGILAAVADAAMGWACMTTLGDGESYTTVEMKINFLAPVVGQDVIAEATIVRRGRSIVVGDVDVRTESGEMVGKSLVTYMVLAPRPQEGAGA